MDIVKKPRAYGNQPTAEEYRQGMDRIIRAVFTHQPKELIFVYKRVLDQLLQDALYERDSRKGHERTVAVGAMLNKLFVSFIRNSRKKAMIQAAGEANANGHHNRLNLVVWFNYFK